MEEEEGGGGAGGAYWTVERTHVDDSAHQTNVRGQPETPKTVFSWCTKHRIGMDLWPRWTNQVSWAPRPGKEHTV